MYLSSLWLVAESLAYDAVLTHNLPGIASIYFGTAASKTLEALSISMGIGLGNSLLESEFE